MMWGGPLGSCWNSFGEETRVHTTTALEEQRGGVAERLLPLTAIWWSEQTSPLLSRPCESGKPRPNVKSMCLSVPFHTLARLG